MKKIFRKLDKWSLIALFVSGGVGFALHANAHRENQNYQYLDTEVINEQTFYKVDPTPLEPGSYDCSSDTSMICTVNSSETPDPNDRIPADQATTTPGEFEQ